MSRHEGFDNQRDHLADRMRLSVEPVHQTTNTENISTSATTVTTVMAR